MEPFHWISVAISIILGLGITRLLSSFIAVFKSRAVATLDWVPLAWAGCIFVLQLQFWWALIEIPRLVQKWNLGYFLLFISLTVLLFLAAALILPHQEMKEGQNLRATFRHDGRWALVFLSAYVLLANAADILIWKMKFFSLSGIQNLALAVVPLLCVRCRSPRTQDVLTFLFIPLVLWAVITNSPESY